MRLDYTVYSVLMVAGLGAAYWASLPTPEGADEKTTILSVDPAQVATIELKSKLAPAPGMKETLVTTIVRRRSADGRFWVAYERTDTPEAPPSPPAGKPGEPAPAAAPVPAPKTINERFLANDRLTDVLNAFHPLYAARVLSEAEAKQLSEFGLDQESNRFELTTDDQKKLSFSLGRRSYGSRSLFVREQGGKGRVLLIDGTGIEELERANNRVYERRLMAFDMLEAQSAVVTVGDKVQRLSHTQRDAGGEVLWTASGAAADGKPVKSPLAGWLDRAARLSVASFGDESEMARANSAKPLVTIHFEKDGKSDTLTLVKVAGKDGKDEYWAATAFLGVPVRLPAGRGESLEKDLPQLMGQAK